MQARISTASAVSLATVVGAVGGFATAAEAATRSADAPANTPFFYFLESLAGEAYPGGPYLDGWHYTPSGGLNVSPFTPEQLYTKSTCCDSGQWYVDIGTWVFIPIDTSVTAVRPWMSCSGVMTGSALYQTGGSTGHIDQSAWCSTWKTAITGAAPTNGVSVLDGSTGPRWPGYTGADAMAVDF